MGKAKKKVSKRSGDRTDGKLDCGVCQCLRLFRDAGVFGNLSAFGVGYPKSSKSLTRGAINSTLYGPVCSVHGLIK